MEEQQFVELTTFGLLSLSLFDIQNNIFICIISLMLLYLSTKILFIQYYWEKGKEDDIFYKKYKIYSFKIYKYGFHCYILEYPNCTYLPEHKDMINGKYYKCNITLYGENKFVCNKLLFKIKNINIFRSDKELHSLICYEDTLKLSIGFTKLN